MVQIIASTQLTSRDGKKYPYAIRFMMNLDTGEFRFVEEKHAELKPKRYMLLQLLARVVKEIKPAISETAKVKAGWFENVKDNKRRRLLFGLKVGEKIYRLDKSMEGRWMNIPDILSMVNYLASLKEVDYSVWYLSIVWKSDGFKMLNPEYAPKWQYFVQEL